MKKIALFMVLGSITLASCNAKEAGNKTAQNEINKKENNSNSKTESKMKTIHLTKAEFLTKVANYEANPQEWKYLGDRPAIIDFYADWCGPCKSIAPVLEELAAEYDGQIYIYKINTETEQELASVFGIRSIPSLLFVPMNEAPQMAQGAMPKSAFKEAIETVLLKKK
ncbi:MAG: thioredoxin [Parabacteroides sp.]|nr:thioredoxin [Parabacteroides sp.]